MENQSYECKVCGYIYNPAIGDPENNIAPGTKFEDIPSDWLCPLCGVGKDEFEQKKEKKKKRSKQSSSFS